jgi:hypothetical protein
MEIVMMPLITWVRDYFDILSKVKGVQKGPPPPGTAAQLHWVPQWVALILGILIQPFFTQYQMTGEWGFHGFWARLLFSIITAVIIFPGVYKNAFDPTKPLLVQLGPIFTSGMGWESLLGAAFKAGGGN